MDNSLGRQSIYNEVKICVDTSPTRGASATLTYPSAILEAAFISPRKHSTRFTVHMRLRGSFWLCNMYWFYPFEYIVPPFEYSILMNHLHRSGLFAISSRACGPLSDLANIVLTVSQVGTDIVNLSILA